MRINFIAFQRLFFPMFHSHLYTAAFRRALFVFPGEKDRIIITSKDVGGWNYRKEIAAGVMIRDDDNYTLRIEIVHPVPFSLPHFEQTIISLTKPFPLFINPRFNFTLSFHNTRCSRWKEGTENLRAPSSSFYYSPFVAIFRPCYSKSCAELKGSSRSSYALVVRPRISLSSK